MGKGVGLSWAQARNPRLMERSRKRFQTDFAKNWPQDSSPVPDRILIIFRVIILIPSLMGGKGAASYLYLSEAEAGDLYL
jgi:hypothetical protein